MCVHGLRDYYRQQVSFSTLTCSTVSFSIGDDIARIQPMLHSTAIKIKTFRFTQGFSECNISVALPSNFTQKYYMVMTLENKYIG